MFFIIAGEAVVTSKGVNYAGLKVAAKCESMKEVKEKVPEIYEEASGLVLVINEKGEVV